MNREDIIRMAREAKQYAEYVTPQGMECFDIYNERFAVLVTAAERDACAKVADGYIGADPIAAAIRARGQA